MLFQMLTLPERFNQNEWFVIILIILNLGLFMILPKRFPTALTVMIILYSIAIPKVLDHTIAVKPFDFYDLNDKNTFELFDLIMDAIYPAFGYLFLYIYDYFNLKGKKFVPYLLIWCMIALGMEWTGVKLVVYDYKGWKLIYSLPIYAATMTLEVILFHFFNKKLRDVKFQKHR